MELEFNELQATSLRELFVKQMEGMILSGKLPVGTKLPTERELSEKMKVSRAVVNGGLSDMEAKGFLQVMPRKGTYVADYKYKGKLDILKSIMEYNGDEFDEDMLASFMQIRRDVEGSFTYFAAINRRKEDLEELESALSAVEDADNPSELAETAFKFHYKICISSGNLIYPMIYYSFRPIITALMKQYYTYVGPSGMEQGRETVRKLYGLISEGDPDRAKDEMLKSVNKGAETLAKMRAKKGNGPHKN